MKARVERLKRYVEDTLGCAIHPVYWKGCDRLSPFLQDRYAFYEFQITTTSAVAVMDPGEQEQSPALVAKHIANVRAHTDGEVVYVRDRITSYNRKRLIERKVPFVIPGNQMYLPTLGIELREHFRALRSEPVAFSPATQALLIHALLLDKRGALTPKEMAKCLRYSPMTMTRAFDELESAALGQFTKRGRERCVFFSDERSTLWTKAQPFLRSPVKRRGYVQAPSAPTSGVRAGLTALAGYSKLAEPAKVVFAMTGEGWRTMTHQRSVHVVPSCEPDAREIEIWSYDPTLFAERGMVDRLSLYLCLRNSQDERVIAAVNEMMKGLRW